LDAAAAVAPAGASFSCGWAGALGASWISLAGAAFDWAGFLSPHADAAINAIASNVAALEVYFGPMDRLWLRSPIEL
jgi:hypothetical protein